VSDQVPDDPSAVPLEGSPPPQPPPPPGYGPTQYAGAEPPLSQSDERLWALLAHLSIFLLAIIAPIVILVVFGKRSSFVADNAKEALNFHITVVIAELVSFVLFFVVIGFVLLPVVIIGAMVLGVIAGLQAQQGENYRYPLTLRLIS
jgi:uncharacterized Tic20 family protein